MVGIPRIVLTLIFIGMPFYTSADDGQKTTGPQKRIVSEMVNAIGSESDSDPKRWRFSVSRGWFWAPQESIKNSREIFLHNHESVWEHATSASTPPYIHSLHNTGGGYCTALDTGYRVGQYKGKPWGLGMRCGWLKGPEITSSGHAYDSGGQCDHWEGNETFSMFWFGVSAWIEAGPSNRTRGFFCIGPSFGQMHEDWSLHWNYTYPYVSPSIYSSVGSLTATGNGIGIELGAEGAIKIIDGLDIIADLSFRMSRINKMTIEHIEKSTNNPDDERKEGDAICSTTGNPFRFDFGGASVQGGLRMSF